MSTKRQPIRPKVDKQKDLQAGQGKTANSQEEARADEKEVLDAEEESQATSEAQVEPAEGQEGDEECVQRRVLPDPGQPTPSQVEDHRKDHVPFRLWCPYCVAGRATGEQHRACKHARSVPVFGFDYLFITKDKKVLKKKELLEGADEEVLVKILVAYDTHSKAVFGHVVDDKGICEDRYAVARLVEDVQWLGYSRLSLRSDNENAILQLLTTTLAELRIVTENKPEGVPDQIIEEHSARYDSSSNRGRKYQYFITVTTQ